MNRRPSIALRGTNIHVTELVTRTTRGRTKVFEHGNFIGRCGDCGWVYDTRKDGLLGWRSKMKAHSCD